MRVARACNPRGTTAMAMAIRDHLNCLRSAEDFEEWYPRDGRPGLSPAQLAAVRDPARLERVTEAMRAAWDEPARRAPHELVALANEEWAKRCGRAARLGRNPSKPKTWIKKTGQDVRLLPRYVHRCLPAIVSPYDISARYARRGETRWRGFLAHVTETCDPDPPA